MFICIRSASHVVLAAGKVGQQNPDLSKLGAGGIFPRAPAEVEAQPILDTKWVQLLGIQYPVLTLGHAQEAVGVGQLHSVLEQLIALLCNRTTHGLDSHNA